MTNEIDLSPLQLAVLRTVWQRGEATVAEVHAALEPERRLASTTVATLLTRLEKRGFLTHRMEGRQFIYRSTISELEVRRSMVSELTRTLFQGDPAALVSHLIKTEDIRPGDLERVRALLAARSEEKNDAE